jgi:hypothetical protein
MASAPINLLPLNSFLDGFWLPLAAEAEAVDRINPQQRSRYELVTLAGFLVEGFAWMDLGVRGGVFPRDPAILAIPQSMASIVNQSELLRTYKYLFRSDITLQIELNRYFAEAGYDPLSGSGDFARMFEMTARAAGRFAADPFARELVGALVFFLPQEFDYLLEQAVNPKRSALPS